MTRSVTREEVGFALLVVGLGVVAGVAVALCNVSPRVALLVTLAVILLLPFAIRVASRQFDAFEPINIASVALIAMFVARPVAVLAAEQTVHIGYDISSAFDAALGLAVLGAAALELGYFSGLGRNLAGLLPAVPRTLPVSGTVLFSGILLVSGVTLYAAFLQQTGGTETLVSLLSGRQPDANQIYLASTAYLYYGPTLLIAASLLLVGLGLETRSRALLTSGALAAVVPVVIAFGSGGRATLLPLVLGSIVLSYLARQRRPSLPVLLLVGYVALTSGTAGLREARSPDTGSFIDRVLIVARASTEPIRSLNDLVLGADLEMFDSLANELAVVPDQLPHQPGATLVDIVVRAVPRPLWQDKPLESNDRLVETLWPAHYAVSRAAPAFSIVGAFYLDGGAIGVVIGMFAVGALLSGMWHYLRRSQNRLGAQILYALALPYVVILLRGTFADTLARGAFTIGPIIAFYLLVAVLQHSRQGTVHLPTFVQPASR